YRADQWFDERAYGISVRVTLPLVDIAIGTEAEILSATGTENPQEAIKTLLNGVRKAVIYKEGAAGSTVYAKDGQVYHAEPFKVYVLNGLGSGDASASCLIYGRLEGWDWGKAARFGNANGAIIVTRQGCANDMPTLSETQSYIESQGGF